MPQKMRALLINPWIYDFAAYDLWSKPLGILTIASYLRRAGFEISLIDCLDRLHPALDPNHRTKSTPYGSGQYHCEEIARPDIYKNIPRAFKRYGLSKDAFEHLLSQEPDPDIILVTTGMTYWYPAYIDAIKYLKKRFSAPIMIGGNYVNLCYDHATAFSGADIVYKGIDIADITGAACEAAGYHACRDFLKSETDLFPAYDLYDRIEYATLRTSRGCPFRCTYCGWYIINGSFQRRDPSMVLDEISHLNTELGIKNFSFYDEALLYDAEAHIIKILEGLIKKMVCAAFHTPNGMHSRFLTEKLAALLKSAGFIGPRIALETSSAERQRSTGSKTTNAEFSQALGFLEKAGYKTCDIGAYILAGLPGQRLREVEDSVRFAAGHGVRIFLEEYSPIPGTPDYEKTGLAEDCDPLLHNNSAFGAYTLYDPEEMQKLKTLVHRFNASLRA